MIQKKHAVQLGVVPTHLKFVGGLVPDDSGRLPRSESGALVVVENLKKLCSECPVPIDCVQIPYFPGLDDGDVAEMCAGFRELGLQVYFILMLGGADPMNPADEDKVVEMLVAGLKAAQKHGIEHVSSTSVEEWMGGVPRKEGDEFVRAIEQNVKAHTRAAQEAGVTDSVIKSWQIEFLRGIEFQTFTDMARIWEFVKAANENFGSDFFKVIVDAAHCGDSELSVAENAEIIKTIASGGALGCFHASAKTTRGCLSTDDGWIPMLLTECALTGQLETVFVEVFHHEDDALAELRKLDPRHGVDTTDGRDYDEVVIDGLIDVTRRLNNLHVRGIL